MLVKSFCQVLLSSPLMHCMMCVPTLVVMSRRDVILLIVPEPEHLLFLAMYSSAKFTAAWYMIYLICAETLIIARAPFIHNGVTIVSSLYRVICAACVYVQLSDRIATRL
ncbi:hypothetical protein IQ07DRAFT_381738 [Pyrenochaeta sp. DS3sAY3a]|nr:hypothetical protein IQ07DRAFT_381738 [Pyrenochaeta sp. DS3sAY3a]